MNSKARLFAIFFATLMIFGSIQLVDCSNNENPKLENNFEPASIEVEGLLPDPHFSVEPDTVSNGSSDEFSSVYTIPTGEPDGHIELIWTHTPGTQLDYVGRDLDNIMPDYNDFVYVYQDFEWMYEQLPDDVEFQLNYSAYLTGEFANESLLGNIMFRIYAWAIDSSGNWVRLYESREAIYSEEYQLKNVHLNYFTMQNIFLGMIETNGIQEDPEDVVRIAVGLAPRYTFESDAWTYFDGSVSVHLGFVQMFTYVDIPSDPASIWQPDYNVTYGTTVGEAFPTHQNATDEVWNTCSGMVTEPDGSVYVAGNTRSSYNLYVQEGISFRNEFLLKYTPNLDLLWAVKNDNMTQVRSLTFHEGFIYTTGFIEADDKNLILTKWSSAGAKIWESEWGGNSSQVGIGVAVHEDGSVFVVASDYEIGGMIGYMNTSLLKFDGNGVLLWEKHPEWLWTIYDVRGDLYIQGNYLYFAQNYMLTIMDLEGEYSRGYSSHAAIPDGADGFYSAVMTDIQGLEDSSQIILIHANATGHCYWNATFVQRWPTGRYQQYIPVNMALTPEETLLVLIESRRLNYDFSILTYDLEGNLLGNRIISTEVWPWQSGAPVFMAIGSAGKGYFAFDIYNFETDDIDINIQAFTMYQSSQEFPLTITTVVIIASSVVIIGAVGAIIRSKKQE